MNRSFLSILAVAGLLVCLGSARAALTAEVRDEASPKFFKAETVKEANEIIREIKHEHGEDLLIETFTEPPADRKEAIEKDRNKAFAEWARDRAKTAEVNGVYILMTHKPEHLQVEVGNKTREKVFTIENRDHLSKLMLGHFKKEEYDRGLIEGVKYVRDTMNANDPKKKPAPSAAGSHETAPPPRGEENGGFTMPSFLGMGLLGWLCVGLVVLAVVWVVIAVIRAISGAGRVGGPGGYGGYGAPGYGGYGGGGGGGFLSGMLGGLFGGMAGGWLYDRFFGGGGSMGGHTGDPSTSSGDAGNAPAAAPQDSDYSGTGGDFDQSSGDDGGGDTGGGGDFGGGDDAGGGDFGGGGDSGGGDFGGGGGDFGGGGDSGGGGGDF